MALEDVDGGDEIDAQVGEFDVEANGFVVHLHLDRIRRTPICSEQFLNQRMP